MAEWVRVRELRERLEKLARPLEHRLLVALPERALTYSKSKSPPAAVPRQLYFYLQARRLRQLPAALEVARARVKAEELEKLCMQKKRHHCLPKVRRRTSI